MKSFKLGFVSALVAGMISVASIPAMATGSYGYTDVTNLLSNIPVEITELTDLISVDNLTVEDIEIVKLDETLNSAELDLLNKSLNNLLTGAVLQTQIGVLQGILENVEVTDVANGNSILTFGDVLSNNDVDIDDVIAIDVLDSGIVRVLTCECCN